MIACFLCMLLRSATDEDSGIALQELSAKIMESGMVPPLLQLVDSRDPHAAPGGSR